MSGAVLTDRRARLQASPLRHLDPLLVIPPLLITALGLVMIYSTKRTQLEQLGEDPYQFVKRQAVAAVLGVVAMIAMIAIDYHKLRELAIWGYGVTTLMLVAVLGIGADVKGAQARFDIGSIQIQPAELVKLFLVLVLAGYVAMHREGLDTGHLLVALVIAGLPMGLIMLEPDLGTDLVLMAITFTILAVGGVKARHLIVLALAGASVAVVAVNVGVLEQYQIDRLTSFAVEGSDPRGSGYNQDQSEIAVGAGGLTGQGLFEGTQTQSAYVPEQHTDFIFTAVGEELGFVGGATLLGLFGLVVWRTWRAAVLADDRFGMLCCVGVLAMFVFQVFENVGMAIGIMPITGIPLPFMSYGGSSIVVSFACIGLVANVHMRRFS
ncbi:MAG: rod shape-determining protein RodA [Actinobacteria bacterium]|nr:rod shape-determining protein RodA [Actinomycetota bacterium]